MKKQLVKFLQEIAEEIKKGKIDSEKKLEQFACDITKAKSVFRLMGYSKDDINVQPRRIHILGTLYYRPDFIVSCKGENIIVFESKSPRQILDNQSHINQIVSYCDVEKIPLGILFNGKGIHVYANTKLPGLRYLSATKCPRVEYRGFSSEKKITRAISFERRPIVIASSNPRKVADVLFKLSEPFVKQKGAVRIASSLAQVHKKEIARKAAIDLRNQAIQKQLCRIKSKPSQAILKAIKENSPQLSALEPTADELRRNWLP